MESFEQVALYRWEGMKPLFNATPTVRPTLFWAIRNPSPSPSPEVCSHPCLLIRTTFSSASIETHPKQSYPQAGSPQGIPDPPTGGMPIKMQGCQPEKDLSRGYRQ